MVDALEAKGLPYAYLLFEGEQHGFRKAETIVRCSRPSCRSTPRSWGSSPAGDVPKLEILHLLGASAADHATCCARAARSPGG